MSRHLIVHAGFHKTGTTSVQKTLGLNRAALAPQLELVLKEDMEPLCEAARAYSLRPEPVELSLVTYEAARFFESLDPADPRPVVMSSEDLSGHMPGRKGLTSYAAAPVLMALLRDVATECLPGARVEFWFTTRDAATWMASCHAQNVRADRYTGDLADFAAEVGPNADLVAQADRIAAAVVPARVRHAAIETVGTLPLGPAGALLDLAGVPGLARRDLIRRRHLNRALPPEVVAELLALNRSDLPEAELRRTKRAVIDRAAQSRKVAQ